MAKFLRAQKLIYHSCQCHKLFCFDNLYTLRYEINGVVSISLESCFNCPCAFHVAGQGLLVMYLGVIVLGELNIGAL